VIRAARDLLPGPGRSITSIVKLLGVSPGTLYNHIPDLQELRTGAAFVLSGRAHLDEATPTGMRTTGE
jgi:AcrR family transcriptional regulator